MPGGRRFRTAHVDAPSADHAGQLAAERVTGLEGATRGAAGAALADEEPQDGLDEADELELELEPLLEPPLLEPPLPDPELLRRLLDDPDDDPPDDEPPDDELPDEPDDASAGAGAGTWRRRTTTTGGTVTGTAVDVGAGGSVGAAAASAVCAVACWRPKAATKPNIVAADAPATNRRDACAGCRRRRRAGRGVVVGRLRAGSVIVRPTVVRTVVLGVLHLTFTCAVAVIVAGRCRCRVERRGRRVRHGAERSATRIG